MKWHHGVGNTAMNRGLFCWRCNSSSLAAGERYGIIALPIVLKDFIWECHSLAKPAMISGYWSLTVAAASIVQSTDSQVSVVLIEFFIAHQNKAITMKEYDSHPVRYGAVVAPRSRLAPTSYSCLSLPKPESKNINEQQRSRERRKEEKGTNILISKRLFWIKTEATFFLRFHFLEVSQW